MKHIVHLVAFSLLLTAQFAGAAELAPRVVSPLRTWEAAELERFDSEWLHVKFVEGSNVVLEGDRFVDDTGLDLTAINATRGRAGVLELRRTFDNERAIARDWKAQGEARSAAVGPDLSLWFDMRLAGGRGAVAEMVNALNADPAVEIAHPAAIPELAVVRTPVRIDSQPVDLRTPDFTGMQDYLYDVPVGLDAPSAWAVPGGYGIGMKFIDVELCWTEDHEDFDYSNFFHEGGAAQDPTYEAHGTAVLGEVIGQHNGFGIAGFAPAVLYGVVAVTVAEWPDVPHRFQEAVDNLDAGDVWLIELQMYPPGNPHATPMEWLQVNYDVIWTSSWSREVVCVEAGANGSQDLDDPSWEGVFDRNIRDSGAIMVGAGTPTTRVAEYFTNYGSRMDVHAWGSEIVTTGYGDLYDGGTLQTRYTQTFGGTSGASPMIAGSALALQGISKMNYGVVMTPVVLRALLHDTGIPHNDPVKEIGPRPDLAAAVGGIIDPAAAPDGRASSELRLAAAPNPFHTNAKVRFALSQGGDVRLVVYDMSGRQVRTLVNGWAQAGQRQVNWNGRDDAGRSLGSGVYYFRLDAENERQTGSIELIR